MLSASSPVGSWIKSQSHASLMIPIMTYCLQIFGFSIWRGHATPGSQLLNLRYRNERSSTPAGAGHTGSTQFSAGSGRSKSLNSSSPSSSGVGASGSGRGGSAATSTSSRPSSALPSAASVPLLGGKTGVEGPGLSLQQRLALGAGMVVVPYLWARLGRMAARGWQGGWLGGQGLGLLSQSMPSGLNATDLFLSRANTQSL
jgi:hypothetical protein